MNSEIKTYFDFFGLLPIKSYGFLTNTACRFCASDFIKGFDIYEKLDDTITEHFFAIKRG